MRFQTRSRLILFSVFVIVAGLSYFFLFARPLFLEVKQGLDIRGGMHVVYRGVDLPDMPVTRESMQKARDIIERRVNGLGVSEPAIQLQGEDRIIVDIPDIKDPEKALDTIGRTALLEFKDSEGNVIISGKDLDPQSVDFAFDQVGNPVVNLRFMGDGVKRFADATRKAAGFPDGDARNRIAIFLDGEKISEPGVNEAIPNGSAVISGYADLDEARRIAISLQSGALPLKLEIIENRTISPTLGQDSLTKSQVAAIIGIVTVIAFMILFYRIPGFWADFALLIYLLLFLAFYVAVNATLTLPGIAGFVLSVGMAVDANIIIFERIKEEIRLGRTIRSALDTGFANALRAIVDSNVTTVLGAAILFWLTTGPVRGFALTLMIGIGLSMFTAVVVTRQLLRLLVNAGLRPGPLFFNVAGTRAGAPSAGGDGR